MATFACQQVQLWWTIFRLCKYRALPNRPTLQEMMRHICHCQNPTCITIWNEVFEGG